MKKLLALVGLLSLGACFGSRDENAFDNRQYMLDEGKYSGSTILGDNDSKPAPAPAPVIQEQAPAAEPVPVQEVAEENLPRYQVVEPAPGSFDEPIPLETAPAPVISPADNNPPPSMVKLSGEDVAVYGPNVPPSEEGKHLRMREITDRPRSYTKYQDFIVNTPRGPVNLWNETVTPEVYEVIATRLTNRMLQETTDFYSGSTRPSVFVGEVTTQNGRVDNGFFLSRKIVNDIIAGSNTYQVVSAKKSADYYLALEVIKPLLDQNSGKILQLKMTMYDRKNRPVKQFSEFMQQVKNDGNGWW